MRPSLLLLPVLLAAPVLAKDPPASSARGSAGNAMDSVVGRPAQPVDTWTPVADTGLSQRTLEAGYRILTRNSPDTGEKEYLVLTPPGFIRDNQRTFSGVKNLRGIGDHIAWERGGDVAYQNLLKRVTLADEKGSAVETFAMVARISQGRLETVTNPVDGLKQVLRGPVVLGDGLHVLGFPKAEALAVIQRVRARVGGDEYIIHAATRDRVLIGHQGQIFQVHPPLDAPAKP